MAVFSTEEAMEFFRENAQLTPAEYLRPFTEVGSLNQKQHQTIEKQNLFKLADFRLNVIDAHKINQSYYKDSEYSGLFQYILDIAKPNDAEFDTIL